MGPLVRLLENPRHLGVDHLSGLLGHLVALSDVSTEEDLLLALADGDGPHSIAHAELRHHAARHLGCLLDILCGASRDLFRAEYELFGHTSAVGHREAGVNVFLGIVVPVFLGQ